MKATKENITELFKSMILQVPEGILEQYDLFMHNVEGVTISEFEGRKVKHSKRIPKGVIYLMNRNR